YPAATAPAARSPSLVTGGAAEAGAPARAAPGERLGPPRRPGVTARVPVGPLPAPQADGGDDGGGPHRQREGVGDDQGPVAAGQPVPDPEREPGQQHAEVPQ